MKKIIFCLVLWACVHSAFSQELEIDSLALQEVNLDLGNPLDTLRASTLISYENLEYIPADETTELIADRLSCLQKKVPLTYNDKTQAFINYFVVKDREYTKMVMRRKDLFFPLFEKYFEKYNLPDELKYLAVIESGLNPKAVSRARAVGLWQFMAGTGSYLKLNHDWYLDDRMDPEKSTEAACKYLSQLYSMFHNWELALAAYNSGPGTVRKAIRRSGYKKSFWEVYPYLPRETRAYVPQYVAIIYAMNYAEEHNIIETAREELLTHDTLRVNKFLHFQTFANLTGTCIEDLQKLNPSVLRSAIPETGKTYVVKIPLHAKLNLQMNRFSILDSASKVGRTELEIIAKKTLGGTYGRESITYTVKSGDVIGLIAERHHVRVEDIRYWNNLSSNLIRSGQRLNIWVLTSKTMAPAKRQEAKTEIITSAQGKIYTVQPGDSLWEISKKFEGLTIEKIKSLNNLKSTKLQPGQKLIVG
ncbi:MAG: LysM peptidoglycan-binding domain-containing protein [Bacteroidia bacterium]|nr:LysM peptidoglycan-binding domain-containing protein [Bacteroidia bacterium]